MNNIPMSVGLDPVVAAKLRQFGRRRLRLIVARGICAGIVSLLLCVALVALIDWYWLLSDNARWCLSGAAYLTVVATVWMTCLRRMMHVPANEEIATQVEQAEPELRENLLSAVELASDDPSSLHDSPVFRSLLQGRVAGQMGQIRVPNLLPFRLVARWVVAATVLVVVAAMLLSSSNPRLRQLAARAMLPGANIARVSRIQVEVLQPTPHSLTLAEDETVAVVVEVTGGSVDDVTLETFTPKQGAVRQAMRGRTDIEFACNIHVADESVEYRILAGDAITRRFRIESRPRPRVTAFHKTYQYPEYSQLPEETVTETHGDLLVLEGTTTELVLRLDQQVSKAELRIDASGSDQMQTIPLVPAGQAFQSDTDEGSADSEEPGLFWKATVPVHEAAIYKVHLVSKETGFENFFSPKYEIRPQPDLIPRAGFVDQKESTLLLPPNDILALQAMAEDDLPLVSLEQHISVNGREWEALPLQPEPSADDGGRHVTASWQWDLLVHELKTGDQVTTKLVATDRKGNAGESVPLRIIVSAPEFDPDRHAIMEVKVGLFDQLSDFSELLAEHKTSALEVIERLRQPERTDAEKALDRTTLVDLASKQREHAGLLLDEIRNVERRMPAGADASDLELTGQVVARLQHEHANVPGWLLKALQHTDDAKVIKTDLDQLKKNFERTADDAKNVSGHYQHLMAHNFLSSVAFDMDALLTQQRLVVGSPTQTWERLVRQETIVTNQLRLLEGLIHDHRRQLSSGIDAQMRSLLGWSESYRQRLQDSMESEEKLKDLQRASQDFLRQLEQKQRYDVVDGGLPNRLIGARRDFVYRSGSLYLPVCEMARAMQQENKIAAQASESQDSGESRKLLEQAERFVAEIDLKHRHSISQLRTRRELTQTRRDSDSQYAADSGLTHRAVTSLLNQHRTVAPQDSEIPDHLLEIAPAYRTLEAGHELILARDVLKSLLNMERWGSQQIHSHIDHPRQWDVVQSGFELAVQRLREARVDNELVAKLDQLRSSAAVRDAQRKITARRSKRDAMIGAGHELVEIRDDLAIVVEELKPTMAEARAIIAKYAPTIPQMAQQAAEQLRQMEEATTDVADAVEQPESSVTESPLSELQQQQETINHQIEDLFEALVEDANSQDLLDDEQRERARDADDSIAMIQEPAERMNRALGQAQESDFGEQQAQELAQAAEQQEQTAQALEMVAEHFERLDEGVDVAESRAELRQAEQELGIARQMDQRFENAEQLAQTASQEAEQLMAELEAELARNPAMQQALSEISESALQEAQNALEFAAQDDQNLQKANEQSDRQFQQKKKELADDLRKMAAEATNLSRALLTQANQSAARGKTPEAQKKFAETQQKLNAAAAKANTARHDQMLADLAETAEEAKSALAEATETLKQAKQQSATGKDEKIHADDKARDAAKKDSEKRRQQFHEQQKKAARDVAKRADDAKRKADQNVKNAENQVKAADRRVQQAEKNLKGKPEDAGRKRNLDREETRKTAEEQKVAAAKELQQNADQLAKQARQKSDEVNAKPLPALNAANPATELAEQYAGEAIKVAEELNRRAEEIAARTDFGQELTPSKNQLAAAEQQQHEVTQDVQHAAEDVARAARHERRLNNTAAVEPLQNAAQNIQQVANNESTGAERKLDSATAEAEQGEADAQGDQPPPNAAALQAQEAIATAETAIARQAEQLSGVVEPMLAAAEAAANAQSEQGNQPAGSEQRPQAAASGEQANAQATTDSPAQGQQPPAAGQPAGGQPTPASFTPEEMAQAQQFARTLDELDRQQAAAAMANEAPSQQSQPGQLNLDTLAQAAQSQQATMSAQRAQAQQQAALALGEGGTESADNPSATGALADFEVVGINRDENTEWGKLRGKSAEDLTTGRSEAVSEEYRKSVETYFRVLAERARKKR
ncbi:MAG: hypothetical protein P8J37_09475 [Fuerstiella sp.]|nr:hypothetical protein [Fuerstiella sp.]